MLIKQYLVDILVKKIRTREINPKTGETFKTEDILISEYKTAVENALLALEGVI